MCSSYNDHADILMHGHVRWFLLWVVVVFCFFLKFFYQRKKRKKKYHNIIGVLTLEIGFKLTL